MATLTPASAAAIARLRAYKPPPTQYLNLPLARRAAVLILLFADKRGDLRVVLTMRANTMKTYAGHAALPGGRADSLSETPFQTARREAYEEIGLPLTDAKLPPPYRVEHLCQLPANLARTELGVRPCVAFLAADRHVPSSSSSSTTTAEETLIPRLSAQEVAAVFSAPFHNFLKARDEQGASAEPEAGVEAAGFPAAWYQGQWTEWHESRWRMHNFYVPVKGQPVARPRREKILGEAERAAGAGDGEGGEGGGGGGGGSGGGDVAKARDKARAQIEAADHLAGLDRFRVFGMTARILVDAARVAYQEEPEFEHNSHFGDEEMIARLLKMGRLSAERRKDDVLTREVLRDAAKL